MTIEMLTLLAKIMFAVGIILTVVAVIFYFKLDIYRAWHLVTGKQIKDKKKKKTSKENAQGSEMTQRITADITARTDDRVTQRIEVVPRKTTIVLEENKAEATTVLGSESENTTVLNDTQVQTTVLGTFQDQTMVLESADSNVTTLLSNPTTFIENNSDEAMDGELEIVEDLSFIHTDIRL